MKWCTYLIYECIFSSFIFYCPRSSHNSLRQYQTLKFRYSYSLVDAFPANYRDWQFSEKTDQKWSGSNGHKLLTITVAFRNQKLKLTITSLTLNMLTYVAFTVSADTVGWVAGRAPGL